MKKVLFLLLILTLPLFSHAEEKQYYIYNIITFEGSFKQENVRINVDDGRSIKKLVDIRGKRIVFHTPAAVLMFFAADGWELYMNGATTKGESINIEGTGGGESSTTTYWILRKPCTKEVFEQTVEEGIKKGVFE